MFLFFLIVVGAIMKTCIFAITVFFIFCNFSSSQNMGIVIILVKCIIYLLYT